jgi:hypothetical protein
VLVQFKFKENATAADRTALLSELSAHGASGVRPVFPGHQVPALRMIYSATARQRQTKQVVAFLEAQPSIEFAELAPERTLAAAAGQD